MKRTAPTRRTPISRGRPITRTTELRSNGRRLQRHTSLRPVSPRHRREQPARRTAVEQLLELQPWCQAARPGCDGRAVDGHELVRRSQGGDYLEPDLAVCRTCHDWITTHPTAAAAAGLARWGWQHRQERAGV